MYTHSIRGVKYSFANLKILLAKATPIRSGDQLAGVAAESLVEMVAAQYALADLPLKTFLNEYVIPPEKDEITRLILQQHNPDNFNAISHFTVGELRDFLLSYECDTQTLSELQYALTPEMVAAVSKIMRNQDLIAVASKCSVITRFRNTIGLKHRFSTRLQPNDPCDDLSGVTSSLIEGLLYGCGDAVIGVNPATDNFKKICHLLLWLDKIRQTLKAPIQSCVLTHIKNTIALAKLGLPIDLFFQSIGGSEAVNKSFGIDLALLQEAHAIASSLNRGTVGNDCMYFETGQGTALSANAHHGVDQQTMEVRAYAVARQFSPLLVNSVVGFIGPEYLFDGKQIIRAGLEDHCCGKLLGLPMGCDICYTNHAYADQNDMDNLLSLLALAGCNFVITVPGGDDIMLNYQSTSYHDAIYIRNLTHCRPSPEFETWLEHIGISRSNKLLATKDLKTASLRDHMTNAAISTLHDHVFDLSKHTFARVGLGHTGGHLKVKDWLHFQSSFVQAKEALYNSFDLNKLIDLSIDLNLESIQIQSQTNDCIQFVLRPDLGELLSVDSQKNLEKYVRKYPSTCNKDLLILISGGLSPLAIQTQIPHFLPSFIQQIRQAAWTMGPLLINPRGRVALGDQANRYFKAKVVVTLIGERPGLSVSDSMGIYVTYNARPGCTNDKRNCISNIHAQGLSQTDAVVELICLLKRVIAIRLTGVELKYTDQKLEWRS